MRERYPSKGETMNFDKSLKTFTNVKKLQERQEQLEQEVAKLRGESGVLVGLLGEALQIIETVDGDDADECNRLMELQNKITYAIRGASV
jgi:hypothetical protein